MRTICCTLCGEALTAPIFIGGKPYGWSCASKVGSGQRLTKSKERYVMAENHTFDTAMAVNGRLEFVAIYEGKRFRGVALLSKRNGIEFYYASGFEIDPESNNIYIRCSSFKYFNKS